MSEEVYCRRCGHIITKDETYIRISVYRNNTRERFLGHFCDYTCLDAYKMDRDLVLPPVKEINDYGLPGY